MTNDTDRRRGQKLRAGAATAFAQMRLAANLSLTELAERAGLPRSTVAMICSGRLVPSPEQSGAILLVLSGPETL